MLLGSVVADLVDIGIAVEAEPEDLVEPEDPERDEPDDD